MAVSAINFIKEMVRQGITQDSNFFQKFTYYFEIHVPWLVPGVSNSFIFPLVIPPEAYSLEEPFAVELTPTQRGGLYAEETGIIQRTIRLRGTTGFKPRLLKTFAALSDPSGPPGPTTTIPFAAEPESKSHSRSLPVTMNMEVSGHRHFQYLQDSVFRTYGDLKRDPATASETMMFFHNPKDEEHWKVIPMRFTLDRDGKRPTLYNYNIELAVVGKADNTFDLDFDDQNILDQLNNALYVCSLGADLVAGTVNDMIAIQDDLMTYGNNINVLLDGLGNIANTTSEFVDGTEEFVNLPYTWVQTYIEMCEAWADLTSDPDQGTPAPPAVTNMFRKAAEGIELITVNPASFQTPNNDIMKTIRDRQEIRRGLDDATRTEIKEGDSPTSFMELEALGTTPTPGEVSISESAISAGGEIRQFRSAHKIRIGKGDTLATLAAQYMNDARLWQYIAIANGLKPPYVDDQATAPLARGGADESIFGKSLGIGGEIVIPSNTVSPKDYPLAPVLGTRLEESVENQILGIDAKLEAVTDTTGNSNVLYDIPIDTELGSTDIKLVEGLNNIAQVIIIRLITEQGTDLLYKFVGIKRIIGLNFKAADIANARYRIKEAVEADPRVVTIRNLKFEQQEDGLHTDLDAVLRGFSETKPVDTILKE